MDDETRALLEKVIESNQAQAAKFDEVIGLLNTIKDDLMPTIESLKTSAIGKMMGL